MDLRYRNDKIDSLFPPKEEKETFGNYTFQEQSRFISIPTQMEQWARYMDLKLEIAKDEIMGKKIKFDGKGGVETLIDGVSIKDARDAIMGTETVPNSDGSESIVTKGQNIRQSEINIKEAITSAKNNINTNIENAKNNINNNTNAKTNTILTVVNNIWNKIRNWTN